MVGLGHIPNRNTVVLWWSHLAAKLFQLTIKRDPEVQIQTINSTIYTHIYI